jgi:hypothetical protein
MMNENTEQVGITKQVVLILIGIIVALVLTIILTVGTTTISADDPIYINGKLIVTLQYDGDQREVWVQCAICCMDDLFTEKRMDNLMTNASTIIAGRNICEFPIELEPGSYKVRLYVRERDENAMRLVAFIKSFEIV